MYRLSTCSDCIDCPFIFANTHKVYHEIHISFCGNIPESLSEECSYLGGKIITVDNWNGGVETMTSLVVSGQCQDAIIVGGKIIDLAKSLGAIVVREKYESSVFHLAEADEQPGYFEGHLSVRSDCKGLLDLLQPKHDLYISQNRSKPDVLMASIRSSGSLQHFRAFLDSVQSDLNEFLVNRREEYCYFDTNPEKDWKIRDLHN